MHETKKEARKNRGLHKDWRTWVVVLLMVGAMGVYVLTLDDSEAPGAVGTKVPAAPAAPTPAP